MYHDLLETALAAARAGADRLRAMWDQEVAVEHKQRFDFVTSADLASQEAVLEVISRRHPHHAILAEETAGDFAAAQAEQGHLWVVDPLDGTTNFLHGYPQVAVSVGVLLEGLPVAGVVEHVTRREVFSASRGGGAFLDSRPLRVKGMPEPEQTLILTGFPFREQELLDRYLALFKEIFQRVGGMRRAGAAALDLADLAAGRAQGFWELGLKPWDLAAGILLVEEAGGVVSGFLDHASPLWTGDVVAGEPATHPWLREMCARHFADLPELRG
ncbi:MAG: inositol monophosphatase [Deltaproteobacteria bacterium]|nr:inositol monophosphatase [Deltaproteobacteria bacterium]